MSTSNNEAAGRNGRDPKKESCWRERLGLQSRSGLPVRAFCEREALKESAFHFWRREIRRRDREPIGRPAPALSFVELRAAPAPAAAAAVECACREPARPELVEGVEREAPLELVLPGDRRLLIRAGCDAGLLQRVVSALAQVPPPCVASVSLPNGPALSLPNGEGRPC